MFAARLFKSSVLAENFCYREGWIDTRNVKHVKRLAGQKKHPEIPKEIDQLIEWGPGGAGGP